jgi:hypothetical protein
MIQVTHNVEDGTTVSSVWYLWSLTNGPVQHFVHRAQVWALLISTDYGSLHSSVSHPPLSPTECVRRVSALQPQTITKKKG